MSKRKMHDEYIREVEIKNPNIEVLGKYIDAKTPILHRCRIDNHKWNARPNNILGGKGCPVCGHHVIGDAPRYLNSIWASEYKDFFAQFMTEEQMKSTMPNCSKKMNLSCPNCGEVKLKSPNIVIREGLGCICGDGQSFPNKFVYNVLKQLCVDVEQEYSPVWAGSLRYDDYVKQYNIIIENHGLQHYEECTLTNRTLDEEQQNDFIKYSLAQDNGVCDYIIIDCRYPTATWIKNSIMSSRLPQILNFDESDVDWVAAMAYATHSLIKDAANMFNDGNRLCDIAAELQRDEHTIRNWLKCAAQLGWCTYMPKRPTAVYCIEMNKAFKSKSEAARSVHTYVSNIVNCIRGEYGHAGRHPETGEPLHWLEINETY